MSETKTTHTETLSGTLDREVGDLIFLWNREAHFYAHIPDTSSMDEGATGVFLEFVQDPRKGKHLWKVLITLRNGNVVVRTLNSKLFKRGWVSDLDDPVISNPVRV